MACAKYSFDPDIRLVTCFLQYRTIYCMANSQGEFLLCVPFIVARVFFTDHVFESWHIMHQYCMNDKCVMFIVSRKKCGWYCGFVIVISPYTYSLVNVLKCMSWVIFSEFGMCIYNGHATNGRYNCPRIWKLKSRILLPSVTIVDTIVSKRSMVFKTKIKLFILIMTNQHTGDDTFMLTHA